MIRSRLGVGLLVGVVVVFTSAIVFFPLAGRFIVAEDEFTHADTAVVLSGAPISRALAARDLYLQRRVGEVLVIPEPADPLEDQLVGLGIVEPNSPPLSERILVASGVPRDKIVFLPEPADGTIAEAYRVRKFLEHRPPRRLVVVTSKFASRRACFIFRHVLEHVEILCFPTPYDQFNPEQWWSQPRNALYVVMEYQKFLVNVIALFVGSFSDN